MPRRNSLRYPAPPPNPPGDLPAPPRFGPGRAVAAVLEVSVSTLGLLALAGDPGDIAPAGAILGGLLAAVGGAVAVYTYSTGLPHHLWGPRIDGWPATVIDVILLLLAVISVGLMAAVHPALGMIAIQGLLAGVFIGAVRRAKPARGCAGAIGIGYGALLLVIGVILYQELRDDPTRTFSPGAAAFLTLVMPGVRTTVSGLIDAAGSRLR